MVSVYAISEESGLFGMFRGWKGTKDGAGQLFRETQSRQETDARVKQTPRKCSEKSILGD